MAEERIQARARVLATAYGAHPERFVAGQPRPPTLPTAVWINRPKAALAEPKSDSEPEVVTNEALRASQRSAVTSTHTQVSPRIRARERFGSIDDELNAARAAAFNTEDLH